MAKDNSAKILSLQKHLEKVRNQANNPSTKRTGAELDAYVEWVNREMKRTETMIAKLKG
jgi:hypothetical protein